MAFDFEYAAKTEIVNRTPQAEPMTYEKALDNSLQDQVHTQIKNWQDGNIMGKNGKPKPSNWFRQDTTGQWMVCWRISNKPVYFDARGAERKGWMPIKGDKVDQALRDLSEAVASHKFHKQLKAAYDRVSPKKAKAEMESSE